MTLEIATQRIMPDWSTWERDLEQKHAAAFVASYAVQLRLLEGYALRPQLRATLKVAWVELAFRTWAQTAPPDTSPLYTSLHRCLRYARPMASAFFVGQLGDNWLTCTHS